MPLALEITRLTDGVRELVPAYGEFWKEAQTLLGTRATPDTLAVTVTQVTKNLNLSLAFGTAEQPLRLSNITSRGAPKTSGFDIYFFGTQVVGRHKREGDALAWLILKAEFQVLYLNALDRSFIRQYWRDGIGSTAYCGYKFVSNAVTPFAKNYPDCHVSYCLEGVPEDAIERRYHEDDEGWKARAKHGQPQIPSAPMDLVALIYMILHCHNGTAVENGWPREISGVISRLPTFRLDCDLRSPSSNWYDHSHVPPVGPPRVVLRRWPAEFKVPPNAADAGWGARVYGRETVEPPHLTITHGEEEKWRMDLRKWELMQGSRDEIHADLLVELDRTKTQWQDLWDLHYPNNKVVNRG